MNQPKKPRAKMTYGVVTLEEIAKELGVSRERVRQIEKSALAKLKANFEQRGYRYEDWVDDVESPVRQPKFYNH